VDSIEKENEERNILSLSLIDIKNDINNKSVSNTQENKINTKRRKTVKENNILINNFLNVNEINKAELIYFVWKNNEQFFNDLTQDNLLKRFKDEKNEEIKNIIYRKALNQNIYNFTQHFT
jgi:hypothetical protein